MLPLSNVAFTQFETKCVQSFNKTVSEYDILVSTRDKLLNATRHEIGIWLPTSGQSETVVYVFLPRPKENEERKKERKDLTFMPTL